ncbi:diguanylate cyclase [Neorhizobium sp. NCHU2750]|uniref:diguanylate cyclase n=1 Tax=Neorhizobium sp. NCHU2750 TaxID=1825976 RepID=UPI000E768F71
MNSLWVGLFANMAVVALIISLWSNIRLPAFERRASLKGWDFGVLFGLGAIGVMLMPFQMSEGFLIDLRMTMIGTSAFIGGPFAGIITAVIASGFRLYLGGGGALVGLVGIWLACCAGMVGYRLRHGRAPALKESLLFSLVMAICSMAPAFIIAWSQNIDTGPQIRLPFMTLVFMATLMACAALANELRRRDTEERNYMYRRVIDSLPEALNVKDCHGRFVMANPATAALMHAKDADALIGKTDFDFYCQDVAAAFRADEEKAMRGGAAIVEEQVLARQDGSRSYLSTLKAPFNDIDGRSVGLITHSRDITDKKLLEAALTQSDRRAAEALSSISDGLVMFDKEMTLVFCNERYRSMFSVTADLRVPGTPASAILYASIARGELIGISPDIAAQWVDGALGRLKQGGTVQFPLADGRWIESRTRPTPEGACFVICSDITESKRHELELQDLNDRLAVLAETDSLTGLLNRRAFDAVMAEEFQRVERGEGSLALLMVDVDYFKRFNDTYGHGAGDACLKMVADCLRAAGRRTGDRAARYGGEEMALILPDTDEKLAFAIAEEFCERLRGLHIPHSGSDKGMVTASIGVAALGRGAVATDAVRLIARADEALYAAKRDGRDCVKTWEPSRPRIVHSDAGRS